MFSTLDYTSISPVDLKTMLQEVVELEEKEKYCTLNIIKNNTKQMLDVLREMLNFLLSIVEKQSDKECKTKESFFKVSPQVAVLHTMLKEAYEELVVPPEIADNTEQKVLNAVFQNLDIQLFIKEFIELAGQKEFKNISTLQEQVNQLRQILAINPEDVIDDLKRKYFEMRAYSEWGMAKESVSTARRELAAAYQAFTKDVDRIANTAAEIKAEANRKNLGTLTGKLLSTPLSSSRGQVVFKMGLVQQALKTERELKRKFENAKNPTAADLETVPTLVDIETLNLATQTWRLQHTAQLSL